jgi:hypothetical protein
MSCRKFFNARYNNPQQILSTNSVIDFGQCDKWAISLANFRKFAIL